jgi:hypothetical protein
MLINNEAETLSLKTKKRRLLEITIIKEEGQIKGKFKESSKHSVLIFYCQK